MESFNVTLSVQQEVLTETLTALSVRFFILNFFAPLFICIRYSLKALLSFRSDGIRSGVMKWLRKWSGFFSSLA